MSRVERKNQAKKESSKKIFELIKKIFESIKKMSNLTKLSILGLAIIFPLLQFFYFDNRVILSIENKGVALEKEIHFNGIKPLGYAKVTTPYDSIESNSDYSDIHTIPIIYKTQVSNNSSKNISITDINIVQRAHINNCKDHREFDMFDLLDTLIVNGEEKELPLTIEPGEAISLNIGAKLMLRDNVKNALKKEYSTCNINIEFHEFFDVLSKNNLFLSGDRQDEANVLNLHDEHIIKLKTNKGTSHEVSTTSINALNIKEIHDNIHKE